jgi:hypothetical protein
MICSKHKITYVGACPKCDEEEEAKEVGLMKAVGGEKKYKEMKWIDNPLYNGGRKYRPEFRSKVLSAYTFIVKSYGGLVDKKKLGDVDNAYRGNLDDIFAVSDDDSEWTNVVHALGGQHGDKVYGTEGQLLGIMQSFGCTTYSRLDVDKTNKTATSDKYTSMAGLIDDSKRIYLHSVDVNLSTVVHEMLHFLCHRDFYKTFGDPGVGKEWKALNEGMTEFLTREAFKGDSHGSYQTEYMQVQDLLKTDISKLEIEKAYFEGKIDVLVEKLKNGELSMEKLGEMKVDSRMATAFGGRGGRRGGKDQSPNNNNNNF